MHCIARHAGSTRVLFRASQARFGNVADRAVVGLLVTMDEDPAGLAPCGIWALDCGIRSVLCRCIRSRRVAQGSVVIAEILSSGTKPAMPRG